MVETTHGRPAEGDVSELLSRLAAAQLPSPNPLPETTAARLRKLIQDGTLAPGSRFPNEPALAKAMGVSRGTTRVALDLLERQGLIWRRHGIGTFVSQRPLLQNRLDLYTSLTELIRSAGFQPGFRDLVVDVISCTGYLSQRLEVPPGTPVVSVHRTHTASGRPVVASADHFALDLMQRGPRPMSLEAFSDRLRERLSIQRVLQEDLGIVLDHAVTQMHPIKADRHLLKTLRLDVAPGSVMLVLEQTDFDREQRPVTTGHEYHVAEFCNFAILRHR